MPVPQEILKLVERFDSQSEAYQSGKYNEAQIRAEFIDPLFKALGWDLHNEKGYAEAYKDVIHEDAIKIGGATEAPDLCFRIGGARKFFVECKKPSVNIKDDVHPAYQLRRYAWSARLPLSILTDFHELAVYDCRAKPNKNDSAAIGRLMYFTSNQFAEKWDEFAAIFSREAVLKGSFDKFAESTKGKKGTASVDDAFLEEIERWRDLLARNIAMRNEKLSQRELNFAVQRIIDRIIFLRICEDRGIEPYGRLMTLRNGERAYPRLCEFFQRADERYNSGLFHFQREKDRPEAPDELTLNLKIDDKDLKDIIGNLYYPESPYEFSVLPADILGHVYERFLGKVIRLTAGHQAKVEDKPEVRKAGGVYYTPTYIVDYIVKNTVGKLLEGKTPKQAAKLKILDPACGSGSFLLGAYQYLLNWHRDCYVNERKVGSDRRADRGRPGRASSPIYQSAGGDYRLMTDEKKRILLNNIYGVDIDSQAVEVTKLSLLLKVLEGESQETITKQFELFHQRALPDLGSNIKCGNSLIGPDFYKDRQGELFGEDEMYRINAFDWQTEYAEIFKAGGFDAVIGNPPYGAEFSESAKAYIRNSFKSYKYKYDSYIYFIERALTIAKQGGFVSFITPELWLKLENSAPLRKLIANDAGFKLIRVCGENVFAQAVVNTIIFILQKKTEIQSIQIEHGNEAWQLPSTTWRSDSLLAVDYRLRPDSNALINKIKFASQRLSEFGEAIQGITPYDRYRGQSPDLIKQRGYHYKYKHDKHCGKWLAGEDIARYKLHWSGEWLRYGPWLGAHREPRFFEGLRLLFREIPGEGKRIQATLVPKETFYHGHSITPFKLGQSSSLDLKFLLGVSNSRLVSWLGGLILSNFGKEIFPKLNPKDVKDLPIPRIDISNPTDKSRHDKMLELVDQMLNLHKQLAATKTDHERTILERQISATDREIDQLVYELYGLTEGEIKIVEESAIR